MLKRLEERLKNLNKVAICYSGGIDSSFLVKVANKVLPKENVIAIIANGQMIAREDYNDAIKFLEENGFNYISLTYDALEIEEFRTNAKERCYYCKKNIMKKIKNIAKEQGYENILDGENVDDTLEFRPGSKATKELGIISPLSEIGFGKKEIRKYAKELGIDFWNKPSNSCLATRFPYDTEITNEKLNKVELAENIIRSLGILNVRARIYNDTVRIEVDRENFKIIMDNMEIVKKIKDLGFNFVTLDLEGIKKGVFDKRK